MGHLPDCFLFTYHLKTFDTTDMADTMGLLMVNIVLDECAVHLWSKKWSKGPKGYQF